MSDIEKLKQKIAQTKKEIEMAKFIKKYNVLACPKSGVPRLTKEGKIATRGLRRRKVQ